MYRVYNGKAEIPFTVRGNRQMPPELDGTTVIEAIINTEDPTMLAEFSTEEDAVAYLKSHMPEIWVGNPMGHAVKYVPVEGDWVDEYDGNDYVGTALISEYKA